MCNRICVQAASDEAVESRCLPRSQAHPPSQRSCPTVPGAPRPSTVQTLRTLRFPLSAPRVKFGLHIRRSARFATVTGDKINHGNTVIKVRERRLALKTSRGFLCLLVTTGGDKGLCDEMEPKG